MKADEQWLSNSYDYNRFTTVGIIFIRNLRRTKIKQGASQMDFYPVAEALFNLHNRCNFYGLCPIPPSSVRVSPVMYLKSGFASCTHTRPISSSESP